MNSELRNLIIDHAKAKTENNGVDFLFAGLGGSKLRGLDNELSDYDFYVFFKTRLPGTSIVIPPHSIGEYSVDGVTSKIDFQYHDIDYYLDYSSNWTKTDLSSLGPTPEDMIYRPNLFTSLSSEIIITDNEFLHKNSTLITQSFKKNMLLDFFLAHNRFVLNSYLKKDTVRLRTYLYVIVDLLCFRWIYEKSTMPRMAFLQLLNEYRDLFSLKEIEFIEDMFESNLSSNKPFKQNLIGRNSIVENFLIREFDYQTELIKSVIEMEDNGYLKFTHK